MSPLTLQIITHYATIYEDFRDGDFSAEAVQEAVTYLESEGMIRKFSDGDRPISLSNTPFEGKDPIYVGTEKAGFYVKYLCEIPLPVETRQFEIPVIRAKP